MHEGPPGSRSYHGPTLHSVACLYAEMKSVLRMALAVRDGQTSVKFGKALWQLGDVPEDTIAVRTEHPRQVDRAMAINGEAEELNALASGFCDGLSCIFDAVWTLVFILVVRLAI